jgi:hypothetical protein
MQFLLIFKELSVAEAKQATAVTRAEFYSTAALLFLFPAILFLSAGGFPENPLRFASSGLVIVAMVGMSITYSIMAIKDRARRDNGGGPGDAPGSAPTRPRD